MSSDDGRTVPLTQEQARELIDKRLDEAFEAVWPHSYQMRRAAVGVARDAYLSASPDVLAAAIPEDTLQQINLAYLRQPPREVSRG